MARQKLENALLMGKDIASKVKGVVWKEMEMREYWMGGQTKKLSKIIE